MGRSLPRFNSVRCLDGLRRFAYRASYLALGFVRHRTIAFVLIAFFMSVAFNVSARSAHRQIERHAFAECMQLNKGITASNRRIKAVVKAHTLIEFKSAAAQRKFRETLRDAEKPVPLAKCHKPE